MNLMQPILEMLVKNDFLLLIWNLKRTKNEVNWKKVIFPSISEMRCFRVIQNLVHFLKIGKNETLTDFLNKILKYFVCILS